MKKNHFWQSALFASALLFGFTACSSDDNGAPQQNTNQERTLTIALNLAQTSTMRTVAESDPKDATPNESAINDVIVAIFDGSGNTVKIERVTSSDATVEVPGLTGTYKWASSGQKITLAAQGLDANYDVYVAANAPYEGDGTKAGDKLLACATKSAFEAITITAAETLSSTEATGGNGKSTDFVMLGKGKLKAVTGGNVTFKAVKDPSAGEDAIDLYRMVSKVYIEKASSNFSGTIYDGYSFEITEMYLDNIPPTQPFALAANTTAPTINLNGGSNSTTTSAEPYVSTGTISKTLSTTEEALNYWFYAMPNASDTGTRLVVKGNFKKGTSSTVVYYPIYLNWTATAQGTTPETYVWGAKDETALPYLTTVNREGKKIYANDAYKITLTIKTIGVTDPKQDLDPQAVEVNVTGADWKEINQNATFTN